MGDARGRGLRLPGVPRRAAPAVPRVVADLARGDVRLAGYGAAAKANTLLNHCPDVARRLSRILDRSSHKHGRNTPGTHVRVDPADAWQADGITHLLILASNFRDEIMRQLRSFKARDGRFVIPVPAPTVE